MSASHSVESGDADAGAYASISAVVVRERQSRDRGWWEDMASCFAPDAVVKLSWFEGNSDEFVNASRAMTARGDYAVHHLSALAIRISAGRALVELPVAIVFLCSIEGVPATLTSRARMQYRVAQTDGRWLIDRISSIYEYDTLAPRVGGDLPGVDRHALSGFRSFYCCLAWYLAIKGYGIGGDLLGDDQPEMVSTHYQRESEWLFEATSS